MKTEFEHRHRDILTEYPAADPERAALALRDVPKASNHYIALMATCQLTKPAPGSLPGHVHFY